MPVGYEFHLDHRVLDAAGWDVVTLAELEDLFRSAANLPDSLEGVVEYLDLSEALALQMTAVGALQLASFYERLLDRGLRGLVIYAPDPETYALASTIAATCSIAGGGVAGGFRLTPTPIPLHEVHRALEPGPDAESPVLVA